MSLKSNIPNFFTSLNLLSGCIGIVAINSGQLEYAAYFVWIGGFFDFLDGFCARLLKIDSPVGKELDSMADMVTFGVLPAMVVYHLLDPDINGWIAYAAFLIAIFSALRLARFNVDTLQKEIFIGLPTPANALFFTGLAFLLSFQAAAPVFSLPGLVTITVLFSLLMVSPIKFIAIKFNHYAWNGNEFKYVFLMGTVTILLLGSIEAVSIVVIWYLLISVLGNIFNRL